MPDLALKAARFIASNHIMTIASCNGKAAWSAPVYYVFCQGSFFFFSKSDARHIRESTQQENCAVSVHASSQGWQDIRGVQMSGTVYQAGLTKSSRNAFKRYTKRFDFIDSVRAGIEGTMSIEVLEQVYKVKWYCFQPDTLIFLDNSVAFGHKVEISPRELSQHSV